MTPRPADAAAEALRALRAVRPLVHVITSPVSATLTANALLALGARPVLAWDPDEAAEVAAGADALALNLGMLDAPRRAALRAAAAADAPWTLDPVGVGGPRLRTETAVALARARPALIRGNATEILRLDAALAGRAAAPPEAPAYAVDAADPVDAAAPAAARLSAATGAVVAVSGARDLIADGAAVERLDRGHPLMTRVTGVGCALSALMATFLADRRAPVVAARAGFLAAGLAGERAAARADGPGTFAPHWLDALAALRPEDLVDDGA